MRRPPGGEARRIEIARAQWFQCGGGRDGRGEWAGGGPAGQPAEQADEAERVGDGAVAVGHRVERRVSPVQRVGGTGEGLRQAARPAPDRGERGAGGEAGRTKRQIERVDPGVGVGEPAGGLGGGHAGAQAVAHRVGRGGGAGIEPGERVGGVAQRDEQAGQLCAGQPGVRAGRRGRPIVGLGRQARSRSASVSSGVSCQDGRSRSSSSSASLNGLSPGISVPPQTIGIVGSA